MKKEERRNERGIVEVSCKKERERNVGGWRDEKDEGN
jgi:hypothetical protein